jgi:large subunit ribosomal protein L4
MNLQISSKGNSTVNLDVSDAVFGQKYNETLVHQLITKYLSAARSGTKAQKNRSAVSGGGLKPFRQKGTGRARAGTTRSPIWRTGGVTFAAQPRSYDQKLNKKMYKAGIRSILSELLRQERIIVSDDFIPAEPKTKSMIAKLSDFGPGKILLVTDDLNENLVLSARNIPNVAVLTSNSIDPVSLVSADKLVITTNAIRQLEGQFA